MIRGYFVPLLLPSGLGPSLYAGSSSCASHHLERVWSACMPFGLSLSFPLAYHPLRRLQMFSCLSHTAHPVHLSGWNSQKEVSLAIYLPVLYTFVTMSWELHTSKMSNPPWTHVSVGNQRRNVGSSQNDSCQTVTSYSIESQSYKGTRSATGLISCYRLADILY